MSEPTPLFVSLDVHKDSIAVAYARGESADPPVYVGAIGAREADFARLVRQRRAKTPALRFAWAYRQPATVSQHIQTRIDALPKPIQDLGWKAQVRLCQRYRRLVGRGKDPNVVVTAIARELIAFMWAIAKGCV